MPNPWDEILEPILNLEVVEQRGKSEDYFEVVITQNAIPQWTEHLGRHLGPPFKAAGTSPSREAKAVTEAYGGIQKNQTLFYRLFDGMAVVAMFWPWSSNQYSTLKMWKQPLP